MKFISVLVLAVLLAACSSDSDKNDTAADNGNNNGDNGSESNGSSPENARFRVSFNANWTSSDFPTQYPSNPHFSPLIGSAHNAQVVFWELDGQAASEGIESMAETGATGKFRDEIEAARDDGHSRDAIVGSGIGDGVGQASVEFSSTENHPLLTMVSMIAPSPDWFVGVRGFPLMDDQGQWIERAEVNLELYDAGTDTGPRFTSANADSSSQNLPITLLTTDRADSDFENGVHFQSFKAVGSFVIERLEN